MGRLLLSRMADGTPEIFASIQGEGVSAGLPSTFVRLAVCNLRCSWCDTAYTWNWARYKREEQILALECEDVVARLLAHSPRNIVITGGEPLIQKRELVPLVKALKARDYRIEFETNGTIGPGDLADLADQFNVSPKLVHSGNEGLRRMNHEALAEFAAHPSAFFKFVVSAPEDLAEIRELMRDHQIPPARIVLMPEGCTAAELAAKSRWLAEACAEAGYRFSTRLHILIWGDKRGV